MRTREKMRKTWISLTDRDTVEADGIETLSEARSELAQYDAENHRQQYERREKAIEDAELTPYT